MTLVRFQVRKIPQRRERLTTPVFCPGEFYGLFIYGVTKSRTLLRDFHSLYHFITVMASYVADTNFISRLVFSVQFSCSVVSDSLRPHESQHARPPCSSPTHRVHSDSGPSSQWYHPTISSSVIPFSSCPQSLPASESFPISQLFTWGGQSTGVSALASFLPKKSQGWSPSEWTG